MLFIKRNHDHKTEAARHRKIKRQGTADAATLIQAQWRGRQGRLEVEKRKQREKPLGFYTHTLGLTCVGLGRPKLSTMPRRRALYLVLEDPSSGQAAQAVTVIIIVTIALSILGFVIETEQDIYDAWPQFFFCLEVFCTFVFSTEYTLRFAVADQAGLTYRQFFMSPLNLLDLLTILPFFVELFLKSIGFRDASALRALRVLRLMRVVRVFKLGRYADGMRLTAKALFASSQAISVLVFLLGMGVVLFSSALFHLERLSCPEVDKMEAVALSAYEQECADPFYRGVSPTYGLCCTQDGSPNDFPSIVAASWWSIVTMTSVGYGDVYPKTTQGKCIGFVVMLTGMVVIALPVAIVGQKFHDVYETHHLEMARFQGAARLKTAGEEWTLVPTTDVCSKLRALQIQDAPLKNMVVHLTSDLEELWEQREVLMRARRLEVEKLSEMRDQMGQMLSFIKKASET